MHSFFLGINVWVELLGQRVGMFNYERLTKVFQSDCAILYSYQQRMRVLGASHWYCHLELSVCNFNHLVSVVLLPGFDLYFPGK